MLGLALAPCLLVGCAPTRPTPDAARAPTEVVQAAIDMGASESPRAALHLKLPRDEMERARALEARGDRTSAEWSLARAQADAELALVLAARARVKPREAQAPVAAAKQELGGGSATLARKER